MKKIILFTVFIFISMYSFCDQISKEETDKEFKIKIINENGDIIKFKISKESPFEKEMVLFSKYIPQNIKSIYSVYIVFDKEDRGLLIPVGYFKTAMAELEEDNFSLNWYYENNPDSDLLLESLKNKTSFNVSLGKYDYDFNLKEKKK